MPPKATNGEQSQGPNTTIPDVLLPDEACQYLRISRRALSDFRRRGIIKGVKLGALLRFRRADLEECLAKLSR